MSGGMYSDCTVIHEGQVKERWDRNVNLILKIATWRG